MAAWSFLLCGLIYMLYGSAQVMEAVHGVTTEEAQTALQRNDWNPVRAEQQLKVTPHIYNISL